MEATQFEARIALDGERIAALAAHADPAAATPGLDWTLEEVVTHLGGVHRWSADLVRERRQRNHHGGSSAFRPAAGEPWRRWYAEGVPALLAALAATDDDVEVWGFGRAVPARAFWARRQAHETAIHRVDVEAAAGVPVGPVDTAFAQDGLDEITGFARHPGFASGYRGTLRLRATDGDDRLIRFTASGIAVAPGRDDADADAVVTGSSSDLYVWAWNRPAAVTTDGDPDALAAWRKVQIA